MPISVVLLVIVLLLMEVQQHVREQVIRVLQEVAVITQARPSVLHGGSGVRAVVAVPATKLDFVLTQAG